MAGEGYRVRDKQTTTVTGDALQASGTMNVYFDIKELSTYLRIKPSTLYAWAAHGKIPCVKIHGLIRFDREEIDQWLESFRSRQQKRVGIPRSRGRKVDLDPLIASAKREVYTARRGETRPKSSLIRKEDADGAV